MNKVILHMRPKTPAPEGAELTIVIREVTDSDLRPYHDLARMSVEEPEQVLWVRGHVGRQRFTRDILVRAGDVLAVRSGLDDGWWLPSLFGDHIVQVGTIPGTHGAYGWRCTCGVEEVDATLDHAMTEAQAVQYAEAHARNASA